MIVSEICVGERKGRVGDWFILILTLGRLVARGC